MAGKKKSVGNANASVTTSFPFCSFHLITYYGEDEKCNLFITRRISSRLIICSVLFSAIPGNLCVLPTISFKTLRYVHYLHRYRLQQTPLTSAITTHHQSENSTTPIAIKCEQKVPSSFSFCLYCSLLSLQEQSSVQ